MKNNKKKQNILYFYHMGGFPFKVFKQNLILKCSIKICINMAKFTMKNYLFMQNIKAATFPNLAR